ncbi:dipeptidyl-peptidase [Bryobacterales bacterium F-183]|nr:dipeptidyl-peptidase [Bryobacterales bacterium F-183]
MLAPYCIRFAALVLAPALVFADDGLWLFDRFPKAVVKNRYGLDVTNEFLDHMRLSSVRFNSGGSGSFISPRGLLFTNHHVGADCIQKVSSAKNDYMKDGFYAKTDAEERACPDLEVNVLLRIEDITAKVQGAGGSTVAEQNAARKAKQTELEKACTAASGNRCDAVTLYSGGQYALYEYKKYTDVRLVFAPEYSVAAFGGDPDNFTYPRYCLDFALFRAYENGKPVEPKHWLRWSKEGAKENELIFVPGNPGSTGRLDTYAQLEYQRDTQLPNSLSFLDDMIASLKVFAKKDAEAKRLADAELQVYQNSYKAYSGFLRGLKDPKLMQQKQADEAKLRKAIADDPAKQGEYGKTWDEIATILGKWRADMPKYYALERIPANSTPLHLATEILRYANERTKPDDQRLREYVTPATPALEQELFSAAPISPELEKVKLASIFRAMRERVDAKHPVMQTIFANGRSAEQAAAYYVDGTKLADIELRKKLAADAAAANASNDPMMVLARAIDGPARELRKRFENEVESVLVANASKIARARLAAYGDKEYPDATFTLRVTFGTTKGYKNDKGEAVPWTTVTGGIYKRATGVEPFALPKSWLNAKGRINPNVPFNYVSTTDTHGGNSGSPTVNAKNEIVGILFDGNIEGLPNRYVFTDDQARSVHVASQGIIESLRSVYKANRVLKELGQ